MNTLAAMLSRGVKVVLAVLVFLLTIEICARTDDALRYGAPFRGKYSADLLREYVGGIPSNVSSAEFEKWQHNRNGFRGPEVPADRPPGSVRIVCLGASESYGLYESAGKEWPAQLREILPEPKYQVINASVVGLSLRSFDEYSKARVLPLKPDVVVLFVNPFLYAKNIERMASIETRPQSEPPKKPANSPTLAKQLTANARSLPKIKQALKQAVASSLPELLTRYQVWNMSRQVTEAERQWLKGRKPKDSVSVAYLDHFHDDLFDFVSFLRSHGVQVLLCSYPALMTRKNLDEYPEIFLDSRRFFVEFTMAGMIDIHERFNAVIRTVAAEKSAMFVDVCAHVPKTTEYFGDNVHYTDLGARLVAEVVAGQLLGVTRTPGVTVGRFRGNGHL